MLYSSYATEAGYENKFSVSGCRDYSRLRYVRGFVNWWPPGGARVAAENWGEDKTQNAINN